MLVSCDGSYLYFNEVFSPIVKHTFIPILLALVVEYELELAQLDVKKAFLHEDLKQEIYMTQSYGFKVAGKENRVCRLIKSLYMLKQPPRQWYKRFIQFIQGQKFTRSEHDHYVYFKRLQMELSSICYSMLTLYLWLQKWR